MFAPLSPSTAQALLSPSARMLAAAAAPDGGVSRAELLPWSDVQWSTLLSLAAFERAESSVYRLLCAAPSGGVPEDVQRAALGLQRVSAFRAAALGEAAGAAHDALTTADVSVLWLKGAALAMQSPEEFAVRGMGDLDVLIPPAQHEQARAALRKAGWTEPPDAAGYAAHHHAAPLTWRGGPKLEMHHGLFPPGHPFQTASADDWLARSVLVSWGERVVRVLPRPWHVVHASVHWAWSHEGEIGSWQYLHDMHRLASFVAGDARFWPAVVEAASVMGARVPVGWGLWSAAVLAQAQVPETVWHGLRGAPFMHAMAERQWVLRAFQSPAASPSVGWSRFWWRRAMRGLGAQGGRWPWALGRGATVRPAAVASAADALIARGGSGTGTWSAHLGRILRS
jgi:Uncharacterised nucleotidyltransferase